MQVDREEFLFALQRMPGIKIDPAECHALFDAMDDDGRSFNAGLTLV